MTSAPSVPGSAPALDARLEAEYNNRARVPEHPELIAAWHARATAYRTERPDALLAQSYGPDARHTYDIFPRKAGTEARSRTALFIHGGYWQALSREAFSHMAAGLNAHGFDVVIANYRLCPAVTVAEITDDLRSLAVHLHARFGRPLLVTGHSAGGHLTAELMATDWARAVPGGPALPADLCSRGLPISGLFDLVPLVATSVNGALGMTEASAKAASPLLRKPPAGTRLVAVVGGDESQEYLRQSRSLCAVWGQDTSDTQTRLDIVPGANHFAVIDPLADPQSALVAHLLDLAADPTR
ncbi:alpha/beta hydrolase [Roseibium aestuarii]|uniref:Alpha/beta hydrolase n=1 Tax=Roseibium aestuarii TaxID=2600299 RepID=A0ABW4JTP1_9HYPH|nr:alpha/beta hydrolase [Roseibium aestuarii]